MPERKELCKLSTVTDDDTGMYHIGEIDGLFQGDDLKEYLKRHGEKGVDRLVRHLGYLQHSVFYAWSLMQNECCSRQDSCAKGAE